MKHASTGTAVPTDRTDWPGVRAMKDSDIRTDADSPATRASDWEGAVIKRGGVEIGRSLMHDPNKRPLPMPLGLPPFDWGFAALLLAASLVILVILWNPSAKVTFLFRVLFTVWLCFWNVFVFLRVLLIHRAKKRGNADTKKEPLEPMSFGERIRWGLFGLALTYPAIHLASEVLPQLPTGILHIYKQNPYDDSVTVTATYYWSQEPFTFLAWTALQLGFGLGCGWFAWVALRSAFTGKRLLRWSRLRGG